MGAWVEHVTALGRVRTWQDNLRGRRVLNFFFRKEEGHPPPLDPPPSPDQSDHSGKNEIYENLVGPFLVHKLCCVK